MSKEGAPAGVNPEEQESPSQFSRRTFLKGAAVFLGGLALGENILDSRERAQLIKDQVVYEGKEKHEITITPEYQRFAQKVLLVFPLHTPGFFDSDYPLANHKELFANLPAYAQVEVIAEPEVAARAKAEFVAEARVNIKEISQNLEKRTLMWAQDILEAGEQDGKKVLIIPMSADDSQSQESAAVAREVFEDGDVRQADFYFEGGNVTFDVIDGQQIVFIGHSDIVKTQKIYAERGESLSEADIARKISETFGGSKVVVMGTESQSDKMFHLDQSLILLEGKQAILTGVDPKDPALAAEAKQQTVFRAQLGKLGYKVTEIAHSKEDIFHRRFSLNAIPFIDKETGERKVIFPVYPDEVSEGSDQENLLKPEQLTGKAKAAYDAYREAGYIPLPVRDMSAFEKAGSLHCLSYVLE